MEIISRTTAAGTTMSYPFETGPINWRGNKVQAFIFKGVPLEGGKHATHATAILVNYVLADNHDLSRGAWAAIVKNPRGFPLPEWQLIGQGRGTEKLLDDELLPDILPDSVTAQLEEIFPG